MRKFSVDLNARSPDICPFICNVGNVITAVASIMLDTFNKSTQVLLPSLLRLVVQSQRKSHQVINKLNLVINVTQIYFTEAKPMWWFANVLVFKLPYMECFFCTKGLERNIVSTPLFREINKRSRTEGSEIFLPIPPETFLHALQ